MRVVALACLLVATAGCSAAPPPVVVQPPDEPVRVDPGPSSMESEIGGMNDHDVERTFGALEKQVLACVRSGSERVRELGGRFVVSLRIDRSGSARWAYLSESTLGDRDTERCVVDLARAVTWPKPVGGEGLASRAFDIDAGAEPAQWEAKRVRSTVRAASARLSRCKKGVSGSFVATAYVRPDGRVLSVGVAPPSEAGEDAADCLADALTKLRFVSPGRRAAKVTFEVP